MKVLIYGAGGVGGYFGGKLAQAGHEVVFVARGEHLAAINKNGLQVKSPNGDFHVDQAVATDDPSTIKEADLIILGVKSWQVKDAVLSVKHLLSRETMILPLQNGVTINDEVTEIVERNHLIGGLCKIISKVERPGVIHHMMFNPIIVAGELDHQLTPRMKNLVTTFNEAGINFKASAAIEVEQWKKFMFICTGGLGALTRVNYGILRESKNTRDLLKRLIAEIYEIGKKLGVELLPEAKEEAIGIVDKLPKGATSSMQRDIMEGKRSEIDYWNGAVAKLGKQVGMEVPVNSFIYDCLWPLESKARGIA